MNDFPLEKLAELYKCMSDKDIFFEFVDFLIDVEKDKLIGIPYQNLTIKYYASMGRLDVLMEFKDLLARLEKIIEEETENGKQ